MHWQCLYFYWIKLFNQLKKHPVMKKNLYLIVVAIMVVVANNKTIAQSANRNLSNLTSPTKINTDLLPDSNNRYNLGSTGRLWKNVYARSAYFLMGSKFISAPGSTNTFIGSEAGHSYTTASAVTATGYNALYANANGNNNTADGAFSLTNNSSGGYNTATGTSSMYSNSSGNYNTANGSIALFSNTIGNYNTANGAYALYSNSSGISNTANGEGSLYSNTTGNYNTGTGVGTLYYNTTGYYNTANGLDALYENTTGAYNTAIGLDALFWNYEGSYNTAIGGYALNNTLASQYNTAVGYLAGHTYNNGYNNVFVGAQTDVNSAGYYNVVAVGHETICTASSQARIGNSYTTSIGGYANWSNVSDVRVKKNIRQNVPGLAFINKLQPITYNLDLDAADKIIQPPATKDKDGKQIKPTQQELDARKAKEQILYSGFAAQDVEKAAKSLNYDFSGVDAAKNNKDLYGLRYAEFVVPLVKSVQELSKMNDQKDSIIQNQNNKIENLEQRLAKIESMMNVQSSSTNSNVQTSASLAQNIPNPFSNSTTISYTLPQQFSSAKIIITDKNGNALKQINLSDKGKGSVLIDASTLSSGAYQYSLIVDGRMIGSKQMILTK
jgi:hypothetical protein